VFVAFVLFWLGRRHILKQRGSALGTLTQDDEARYRALCERIRAWHQEHDVPLNYPPATEEQVRQTEAELGVPLPPLLRMLYTEVGNGGYLLSLDYPFFGVGNSWPDTFSDDYGRKVRRLSRSGWQLHPCMAQALKHFPDYMALSDTCPEGFLILSDRGCGTSLECELPTGRIYLTGPGPDIPREDPSELGWTTTIQFLALSLEDCLNAMLDGTLYTRNRTGRNLSDQDIDSYIKELCSDDVRTVWRGLYRFSPDFFTPMEPDLEEWDIDASAFDLPNS
jgi:hypothetical protein